MKIGAPKGTRDILPAEIGRWRHAEQVFAQVCALYGYEEIRIPTFESTDLFQRGVGDTTDIVQKEMYTFNDKGGRSISLRPEATAGVVRSYIENGMGSMPAPIRLFYSITAFRYENVQKGRYREFHQLGAEAFGSFGPGIDAEMIGMLSLFFERMGVSGAALHINSIGCPDCRSAYNLLLREYLQPHLSGMCETCGGRFERNPLRILDCKEDRCRQVTVGAPRLLDHLCESCRVHFDGLKDALTAQGIRYEVDAGIVRGLDYYTRTVFEFVSENVGTQGTICGGGRYDGLVESIGGAPTPGVGFSMGLERLLMEIEARGIAMPEPAPMDLYIAALGAQAAVYTASLAARLRRAGIRTEIDQVGRSLKAQMKYAGKRGVRFTMVLGDSELESGQAVLRRMSDGTEEDVPLAAIESDTASILASFGD